MPTVPPVFRPHGAPSKADRERVRQADTDRWRGSAHQRGYGRKWAAASKGWIAARPLCVAHHANGFVVPATLLDHIVPHKGDMVLFWDPTNWQGLCVDCHISIKATIERQWAAGMAPIGDLRLDRPLPTYFIR